MRINIDRLIEFIKRKYRGNQSFFAEDIGVDRSYLNQLLNGRIDNSSPKICNKIINYCEKNNIDYRYFIF